MNYVSSDARMRLCVFSNDCMLSHFSCIFAWTILFFMLFTLLMKIECIHTMQTNLCRLNVFTRIVWENTDGMYLYCICKYNVNINYLHELYLFFIIYLCVVLFACWEHINMCWMNTIFFASFLCEWTDI